MKWLAKNECLYKGGDTITQSVVCWLHGSLAVAICGRHYIGSLLRFTAAGIKTSTMCGFNAKQNLKSWILNQVPHIVCTKYEVHCIDGFIWSNLNLQYIIHLLRHTCLIFKLFVKGISVFRVVQEESSVFVWMIVKVTGKKKCIWACA
jgi:hypothetical protein